MLVIDVDGIYAQPPERAVAGLAHILRPAVYASPSLTVRAAYEAELRGDPHFVTPAADRLADQLLVFVRAVGVRRVEQIDPQVQGPVDSRDGLGFVGGPVGIAHAHASESHRGDGQPLPAEPFLLHVLSPCEILRNRLCVAAAGSTRQGRRAGWYIWSTDAMATPSSVAYSLAPEPTSRKDYPCCCHSCGRHPQKRCKSCTIVRPKSA